MEITRVQVLAAAARTAAWPQANAADQEHAVFRRLKVTGEGVLFRLCADRGRLVPGIINDGRRLIDETQPLVLDFPSDGVLLDLVAHFAADHGLSVFNDDSLGGALHVGSPPRRRSGTGPDDRSTLRQGARSTTALAPSCAAQ